MLCMLIASLWWLRLWITISSACGVCCLCLQAPRGAFIIPDIVSACRQGYTQGESFDPDRFR